MKKRTFFLLLLPILAFAYLLSCQKGHETASLEEEISNQQEPTLNENAPGEITLRSGDAFSDNIDILYLGAIDLISNSTLRTAVKNKALEEGSDDWVSFSYLITVANQNNLNLVQMMENSVTNNGGTTSQRNQVSQIINGFTYNGETYSPMIYFPYAEDSGASSSTVLAKGALSIPSGTYTGRQFGGASNGSSIEVTQTVAQQNQLWIVTASVDGEMAWAPWRRCYCTRGFVFPDGTISGLGRCSAGRNDENCGKCGRANFSGDCPGDTCPGC